jgi:hypothetical protein
MSLRDLSPAAVVVCGLLCLLVDALAGEVVRLEQFVLEV